MSWYWALPLVILWVLAMGAAFVFMVAGRRFWLGSLTFVAVLAVPLAVIGVVTLSDRADEREACEAKGGTLVAASRTERVCIDARVL